MADFKIGDEVNLIGDRENAGNIVGITGRYLKIAFKDGWRGANQNDVEFFEVDATLKLMDALIIRGQRIIDRDGLMGLIGYRHYSGACGCMGSIEDEPLCNCAMGQALQDNLIAVIAHFDADAAKVVLKNRVIDSLGKDDLDGELAEFRDRIIGEIATFGWKDDFAVPTPEVVPEPTLEEREAHRLEFLTECDQRRAESIESEKKNSIDLMKKLLTIG